MKLGEIVHDSIIENKEKTKSYWEQLMLAASSPPSSPAEVKQSNSQSPSSQVNHQAMNNLRLTNSEPAGGPKIVETFTKINLQEKNNINGKIVHSNMIRKGSVIDREIQMQKEREAAFAQEREEALQKANKSVNSESRVPSDQEETLNYSIPTTDDGNFSEYGSEEKEEHSLDESRMMGLSPEMTVMRSGLHRRTQSMDSMSSGHSSGSIGSVGSGLPVAESCVRRRVVTVRPLDQPEEENLLAFVRNEKETPIEREIRLSREREEELRREKQLSPSSEVLKTRSKSLTCESISAQNLTEEKKSTPNTLPLSRGCVKKVFYITHSKSVNNISDKESESPKSGTLNNTQPLSPVSPTNPSPNPSAKGAVPKLFSRNPNQKGLMKRFIASRGRLNSTFTFAPSPSSPVITNGKSNSHGLVPLSPVKVQHWNPTMKKDKDAVQVGTRPGYVSAEDKIQVELQEMRKREQELKEQRQRSFIRSQPDLLSLLNDDEEEEKHQVMPLKLRSALSNPNLIDMDDNLKSPTMDAKTPIKRSSLIDVWESMIQKK